jgi:hypothetical protein
MIQCPECKTTNQPNARFCSGCGVGFTVIPQPVKKKNSIAPLFWVLGLLGLALFIGVGNLPDNKSDKAGFAETSETSDTQSSYKNPPLRLLSSSGERTSDAFLTVHGEVQNNSTEKLDTIWAVVSLYDANGQFISSEDSVIDYTPLMPNQKSPFKVMVRRNPLMETYKIGFKTTLGGELDYIDSPPQKSQPTKKGKSK